jgi:putative membrane protein
VPQARLHPLTLFFAAWNTVRGFIIPALVVIFLRRDRAGLGWVPVAATMGAAALAYAMLKYFTFSYWISEAANGGELVIRSGVISKTERHIPLARVQDVRLTQGLMHRLLRVVEVQVETAGGQGAEAKLSVLSHAEAARLRDAIFSRRVVLAGQRGPGADAVTEVTESVAAGVAPVIVPEPSTGPARQTVRRVSTRELVLAGLTSNQVASGLAVVGAAFALVDDLIDLETMGPSVVAAEKAFEQWLAAGGRAAMALVVAGGVVLLAVLGLVISVAGSVLLFYGFELSLAGEDLHRSYGLFTRHASSLPRRRIQLLRVEEGLLRRMLKLATLRVNSAGSKPAEGEADKGLDVLLPVVPRREINGLLPVVFPEAGEHARPDWRRVSRRAIWRGTFNGSVVVIAATIAAVLAKGLAALPLLGLVAVVYAVNVVGYRNLGYAKDAGFFRTRRGWLSRSTHVVPVRNVQAIVIRQNPLDRRHRVGTVQVDTAGQAGGAGPSVANVPWEDAVRLATELAHQAAAERYKW